MPGVAAPPTKRRRHPPTPTTGRRSSGSAAGTPFAQASDVLPHSPQRARRPRGDALDLQNRQRRRKVVRLSHVQRPPSVARAPLALLTFVTVPIPTPRQRATDGKFSLFVLLQPWYLERVGIRAVTPRRLRKARRRSTYFSRIPGVLYAVHMPRQASRPRQPRAPRQGTNQSHLKFVLQDNGIAPGLDFCTELLKIGDFNKSTLDVIGPRRLHKGALASAVANDIVSGKV
jgi:hypothetical protein